jgi:hypothetical protein
MIDLVDASGGFLACWAIGWCAGYAIYAFRRISENVV